MNLKNYEVLPNGIEVVYVFGSVPERTKKRFVFLAGTTSWNSNLVNETWRRAFLDKIGKEKGVQQNTVFCVPEPQRGIFLEETDRHLIEWETEYLDLSNLHVYWLNTYWTHEQAVSGAEDEVSKFFADGRRANIGVTVRCELGASFGRYKYAGDGFKLIVGAPEDARGLAWISIQNRLSGVPVYWLDRKDKVFSDEWYRAILSEIT